MEICVAEQGSDHRVCEQSHRTDPGCDRRSPLTKLPSAGTASESQLDPSVNVCKRDRVG